MANINAGQTNVVMLAPAAPGGVVNVHGRCGTGKSHVMGEIGRLFTITNKGDCHILATSSSNISTKILA